MGNDKKSWQQPNEDHDGGNDEKQKEAGQKARKDMNLQICQTRTPLSLRALGLLLAGSASTVQWGGGRLFDASANFFFTKTAITRKQKEEKLILRWEMNRLSEGYKRTIEQNWGRMAKIGFLGQKPRFWAQKKWASLL